MKAKQLCAIIVVMLAVTLNSCAGTAATQIAADLTEEPTLTPAPVPISEIQLDSIVIQEGDLPAGFSGAQIRDTAPEMFKDLPSAQNTVYQQLEKEGDVAGGITIFLYDSQDNIETAYNLIVGGLLDDAKLSDEVGEKAIISSISITIADITIKSVDMAFVRCGAVVHIRMSGTDDVNSVVAYAKRLDNRLKTLICQ